ncbi:hypothetical protein [Halomonas sp. AOP43-D1-4]|uniref:hypothetical protein n=1 Tax=Halomonas sp. AOP43-D1-4 TaxID=3457658 RepID=UPI0040341726
MNQDKNRGLKINISTGWEHFWGIFHVCLPTLYVKKRTDQGLTKLEIIRCLKRYIAREVYHIIRAGNRAINQVQIDT